ncbi:MAG TPA: hypothetical protein VE974_14345 [Thermoanaerobaculia bacterium]|nr:hypothetical protein [Thermoanaerobaculia bacterium]
MASDKPVLLHTYQVVDDVIPMVDLRVPRIAPPPVPQPTQWTLDFYNCSDQSIVSVSIGGGVVGNGEIKPLLPPGGATSIPISAKVTTGGFTLLVQFAAGSWDAQVDISNVTANPRINLWCFTNGFCLAASNGRMRQIATAGAVAK